MLPCLDFDKFLVSKQKKLTTPIPFFFVHLYIMNKDIAFIELIITIEHAKNIKALHCVTFIFFACSFALLWLLHSHFFYF